MKFLSAAAAVLVAATAFAGDVEFAGMKAAAPKGWKEEEPSNPLRLTQFKFPKADGDPEDAELAVFKPFPKGASGGREANLERQVKKFKPAEGKDKVESKVETIKVGTAEATYQDLSGVYQHRARPADPSSKLTEKPGYRQLYVLLLSDSGDYYMTLVGPAKTIEKHKKDFEEFLKTFK